MCRSGAVAIVLFWSLCVSSSQAASIAPLGKSELDAVVKEIRAMVNTDQSQVTNFIVREATPDRIERFYLTPGAADLPRDIRENGLIFAGRGSQMLSFDKPSDVIEKVATWFPAEVARARASNQQRFFTYLHLWGPFENWDSEPAAFLTLWNCMPQNAWLKPAQNPFMHSLNEGITLYPIAARSSADPEFDFGYCVRKRSGYLEMGTMEEAQIAREKNRIIGEGVTPVLQRKFARFLANNRCRGTGPDDCVLVLRLWASLTPSDAELAATIQSLEADIAPDGPLPEGRKSSADSLASDEGENRFDQGLRRAAFLRAKLLSVLNAPNSWKPQSLAETLHQMTLLRQAFADPFVHRRYQYELDYRNNPVNPWLELAPSDIGQKKLIQTAIVAELENIDDGVQCEVFKQWFDHGGKSLQTNYSLQRLVSRRSLRCAVPDWEWLKKGEDDEALDARNGYITLLGQMPGETQDMLLSGLTGGGQSCFDNNNIAAVSWLHDLCGKWISEPQTVQYKLQHSQLSLSKGTKFLAVKAGPIPASVVEQRDSKRIDQEQWLNGLVQYKAENVGRQMRAIAEEFAHRGIWIQTARKWRHPKLDSSLVEIGIFPADHNPETDWPFAGERLLLVIKPQSATLVGIPGRFGYQYDSGEIANVSDLDQDGNFEVWFKGTFGECDGEGLRPGVDCAIETIQMGEIRGNALSYFTKN